MSVAQARKLRGRQFFANPGPTNIPDSVLRAIDRPTIDFHDPDFVEVYDEVYSGLKRVLGTEHHVFMYTGSGHAAWEATLTNLLSPGDTILLIESGYFSEEWGRMAAAHGVEGTHRPHRLAPRGRDRVGSRRAGRGQGARHQGGLRRTQ